MMETRTLQLPFLSNISIFKADTNKKTNNSSLWTPTVRTSSMLTAQLKQLPPELSFSCLFCNSIFNDPDLLLGHMEKSHPKLLETQNTEVINLTDDDEMDYDEFRKLMEPICELSESNETVEEDGSLTDSIKIPQGPGRGRRREMDKEEMEMLNASGECFFKCFLCDKEFKFAGDLAKHIRSRKYELLF